MFQVANAIALSEQFDVRPVFIQMTGRGTTVRNWEIGVFGIQPEILSPAKILRLRLRTSIARELQKMTGKPVFGAILDSKDGTKPNFSGSRPRTAYGYWQSPAFFENSVTAVRQQFGFPDMSGDDIASKIKNTPQSVAIHVRRGDYVTDPVATKRHLICDAQWYEGAWDFVRKKIEGSHAFVFSDDPAWVRQTLKFGGDVTIVEGSKDEEPWMDMARMSLCNHFVISNSSYSWWSAYLSNSKDKTVVAPKYWVNGVLTADIKICPDEWILL